VVDKSAAACAVRDFSLEQLKGTHFESFIRDFTAGGSWNTEGMPSQYETDYHQWAIDTANALRAGRFNEIDIEAAAEEIEDLARSQRWALRSALVQLVLHLLKTRYQPDLAGRSWEISIEKQRVEIADLLDENPSLRRYVVDPDFLQRAYKLAMLEAERQTGLSRSTFPAECPFTFADING
jgi:hypothetical protein